MNSQPNEPMQPEQQNSKLDDAIARQFQQTATRYQQFSDSWSDSLKTWFAFCEWQIVPWGQGVELIIHCPSSNIRTQLLQNLLPIATRLKSLFGHSQIQIWGDCYPFVTTTEQVIQYHLYWRRYKGKS